MSGYWLDWANLLIRWGHLITGIAWIGSSFYLLRAAPAAAPGTRPWFYWEAYGTWLSGMALLGLLYFLQAKTYLIDPQVRPLSQGVAVAVALALLIGSWLAYEALCRSALGHSWVKLGIAMALLLGLLAFSLCALFSGRAAFLLFGATLGTFMAANVCLVPTPIGQGPLRAGQQRALHNTFLTLPVLFAMISNHFAMTYGAHYNWLVLIDLSFAGVCIRAWFVARHQPEGRQGFSSLLPLFMGILALIIVIIGVYPDAP